MYHFMWLFIVCLIPQVWSLFLPNNNLNGKHIKAAIGPWSPYIMWKCAGADDFKEDAKLGYGNVGSWGEDCPHGRERKYKGIMIDLIQFMAKAGNFTYTLVESDDVCGRCYSRFNCSGMTGLVNRGEVDLALGKNRIGV